MTMPAKINEKSFNEQFLTTLSRLVDTQALQQEQLRRQEANHNRTMNLIATNHNIIELKLTEKIKENRNDIEELKQKMASLEAQQAQSLRDGNSSRTPRAPTNGNLEVVVTADEHGNFGCPMCKSMYKPSYIAQHIKRYCFKNSRVSVSKAK